MSLCKSRSRLENASAYEQSNRPSHRTRSARAVALLQPVSRGGPPAVVLSFAKIPKRKRESNRNRGATAIRIPHAGNCQISRSGCGKEKLPPSQRRGFLGRGTSGEEGA